MSHIEQIPAELACQIRRKVLYPDLEPEKVRLAEDETGMHLGLFDKNTLISVVSLFMNGTSVQFRKFATIAEYQSQGYGTELLQYILDWAKAERCIHIWCNARENATGFYSKFGFSKTDKTFQMNGHNLVIMEKTI